MAGMLSATSSTNAAHQGSHVRTAREFPPMTIKSVVDALLLPHISHRVICIDAILGLLRFAHRPLETSAFDTSERGPSGRLSLQRLTSLKSRDPSQLRPINSHEEAETSFQPHQSLSHCPDIRGGQLSKQEG